MNIKTFLLIMITLLGFTTVVPAAEQTTNVSTNETAVIPSDAGGVEQQLQGFNLNGYDNSGKKSWEVNGEKADISDNNIKVCKVVANFYGKENANLKSDTGTINKTTGEVHLKDNVVITADRGTQMTTDTLNWDRNNDLVTTADQVKITDDKGVITGKGLIAHPNLKQASIGEDVKAVINSAKPPANPASQKVTITCDGPMQMDQAKFHATFSDNVVAIEEATGRMLYADRMDVWFDDKNKKLKKVICKGNVKAIQGDNASYADEMVYTGTDEKLIMTGRPKLVFDTGSGKGSGMFQQLGK
jgi:LPS export ABC transporter protein LptC